MDNNTVTRTSHPVVLWLVLIVSCAANAGGSLVGFGFPVRMVAGGIAIVAIALLITYYVRRRGAANAR